MAKISIITAVRNGAKAIEATIRSVNEQSHPDIEHVLVDGASSDGTQSVISAMATRDPRFVSEPDKGVYDAFNKGLRMATGDIVCYLNAGDSYTSSSVIARVNERFAGSSRDAVFGDVEITDDKIPERVLRRYQSGSFSPARIPYGFMPAHPALFLTRRVYERAGPYAVDYKIAGDFELIARIFAKSTIDYEHLPEVFVRMPRGGLSTSGPRSNWIITREMKRACEANGIDTNYFKLTMRFPIKLLELIRK